MQLLPLIAGVSLAIAVTTSVLAEPAIYKGGTLTIPVGAMITDSRQQYYQNIVLQTDASGNLTLVSAEPLPKVTVETAEVLLSEAPGSTTASLAVTGYKSVPCTVLQDAAVQRSESHYTVILAESVLGPAETCIAVIDPFELDIPLDTSGLAAGTYTVDVNGIEVSFELTGDMP